MLIIPGRHEHPDRRVMFSRRDVLRVGGSALMGLTLADALRFQDADAADANQHDTFVGSGPGWNRAKSIILLYLQGGPSQIDLWDPKSDVPDNVRSEFKRISTNVAGLDVTEVLPKFAQVTDRVTLIRSMNFTPVGLFNHTAAIYQSLTGYTADRVSPAGQLEPPSPKDFPNFGANIARLKPPDAAMLPLVMMPRPLQESNVIGKAGTAGFLGREYDPYYLFPPGDDSVKNKLDNIKLDGLQLRPEVSAARLARRERLLEVIKRGMPDVQEAVERFELDKYHARAMALISSGRAREAFDLQAEPAALRDRYGRNNFGQSCLLARRLVEAGTRVVEVVWPYVANADNDSWDHHVDLKRRMETLSAPVLDAALSTLVTDLDQRGMLAETLLVAVGEFGRSPQRGVSTSGNLNSPNGRDHWPYCYTALVAGAGVRRGFVYGASDKTASAPIENPVHACALLATIYHAFGINPRSIMYNHLNQPRELVKGDAVTGIFG